MFIGAFVSKPGTACARYCARHFFFFQGTFSFAELSSQIQVSTYLGETSVGLCFASSTFSLQLLWLFPKEAIGGGQFTMYCQ